MHSRSNASPAARVPWLVVAVSTAFALYWVSNLVLWMPWSMSETLGIVLMLTVSPLIWAAGSTFVLTRWEGANPWAGATATAAVLLTMAVAADLVFFTVVRGAADSLMQPTTIAGYAWVIALPYLIVALGRQALARRRRRPTARAAVVPTAIGITAVVLLQLVIAAVAG